MSETASLQKGAQTIKDYAASLPASPGVYRMLSEKGDVLYVGKAKALNKRVMSYTNVNKLPSRLQRMVAYTKKMEFVYTNTEVEALLLESNLIKKLEPRYNILLRDDKSFPYIHITSDHDFPQMRKHRGARSRKGDYFGPFASAGAVNRTIQTLQRVFKIRNCTDNVFANRSRPCLQYHIKRCTAPCVDYVSKEEYAEQIEQARQFLTGENRTIQDRFADLMQKAAEDENFEQAADYRDRIRALASIQSKQDINLQGIGDVDVMALVQKEGRSCIQIFFFRGGQNFGNRAFFPKHEKEETPEDIMSHFIGQFYDNKPVPSQLFVSVNPSEKELLEEALTTRRDKGKVSISKPSRGKRKRLIDFVLKNAKDALKRNISQRTSEKRHLDNVAELFDMDGPPSRIEVYDNSHISGTNMVGAMVVAGEEGFQKNAYRKFNIKEAAPSDDYGMMREVMERRFGRALKEGVERGDETWPDLLLIDGGLGQFNAVKETLEELGVFDKLMVVGIAKGEDRNAGREQFFIEGKSPFQLPINDPTLHYLQRLRDEVHRFAIGAHRARRSSDISKSPLDNIAGIGPKTKKALLSHFGSAKSVARAGIQDLIQVEGISENKARDIYNFFNES
ncbi:MAG: excinuclease ABC subunit UvrC [Pseudomonadota bacterium]